MKYIRICQFFLIEILFLLKCIILKAPMSDMNVLFLYDSLDVQHIWKHRYILLHTHTHMHMNICRYPPWHTHKKTSIYSQTPHTHIYTQREIHFFLNFLCNVKSHFESRKLLVFIFMQILCEFLSCFLHLIWPLALFSWKCILTVSCVLTLLAFMCRFYKFSPSFYSLN